MATVEEFMSDVVAELKNINKNLNDVKTGMKKLNRNITKSGCGCDSGCHHQE